ncbi:MAG: adenine phosphoribosyltransferase [Deltaproteobacteria bacterium]|nr:adenine phosphoribosyltransferase [Deltaproteobacteria bacterium]
MTIDRIEHIKSLVRPVPDFPKPGILFRDITPMLAEPRAFNATLDIVAEEFAGQRIDAIVGIESRGFIFGASLASRMAVGFVPARKPGKLPVAVERVEYALEYGTDALEMHRDSLGAGRRVLVVDDVIATGGTAWAACELVRRLKAEPVAVACVIELTFLPGRGRVAPVPLFTVVQY